MASKSNTKTPAKDAGMQKELAIVMVLSLLLGLGGGYVIGTSQEDDNETTSHSTHSDKDSGHSHAGMLYNVSESNAPTIELVVVEDAKSGYNIELKTTNFTFTPGDVNGENVASEGHGHIYVDGEKVARVYGKYFHWDGSFEGTKTFSATLNANDHSEYAINGEVIRAELDVTHDSNDSGHEASHMKDDMDHHSDDDDAHSHSDGSTHSHN